MPREHRLFAALYDRLTASAERNGLAELRARLINPLQGDVLELGAGTGANLEHYGSVRSLTLVEPDRAMARRLRRRAAGHASLHADIRSVGLAQAGISDSSVDAVVCTLVLCSASDPIALLGEVRRILRPDGVLVVIEHVRHPNRLAALVQRALTPAQRVLAAGCRLDRPTAATLASAGFDVTQLRSFSLPSSVPVLATAIAGPARVLGRRS